VDSDYAAITVLGEGGVIDRIYVSGISPESVEQMGPPPSGRGVLGLMGTETSALRVDRISSHSRSVGFPAGHPPMESLLGVAVQRDGVHLANLYLTRRPGRPAFTVDDQKLVETASHHVAAALENARLYAEESRLRRDAEAERRRRIRGRLQIRRHGRQAAHLQPGGPGRGRDPHAVPGASPQLVGRHSSDAPQPRSHSAF
jgi:GAF domain-containing protein